MAYIKKLADKPRGLPWRAQVRRKGHKPMVKMFASRAEAEGWASEQERQIRLTGLPLTIDDLKKTTVGEIVRRYLQEITPTKASKIAEAAVLNKFVRENSLCSKALAYVSRQDAHSYVAERLKQTWQGRLITPRTARREVNILQHVFEVAKERWGFTNLPNHFRALPIKGSVFRRERRLEQGELERLLTACETCRDLNRIYVPLAIDLAIETGMRQQELFNLTWNDLDVHSRRIRIRKSKTDHKTGREGRTIVLPFMAELYCNLLFNKLARKHQEKLSKRISEMEQAIASGVAPSHDPELVGAFGARRIFPMSKEAFKQSWADVVKRSAIKNLHFHDLRHEAASRFDAAGLTAPERNLMLGHTGRDIGSTYVHADLKNIQDKLDRHFFKGEAFEEIINRVRRDGHPDETIIAVRALHDGVMRGLTEEQRRAKMLQAVELWRDERVERPSQFLGPLPDRLIEPRPN